MEIVSPDAAQHFVHQRRLHATRADYEVLITGNPLAIFPIQLTAFTPPQGILATRERSHAARQLMERIPELHVIKPTQSQRATGQVDACTGAASPSAPTRMHRRSRRIVGRDLRRSARQSALIDRPARAMQYVRRYARGVHAYLEA